MGEEIRIIEYHMMKKERYLPSTFVSGVSIRGITYPSMLIKTRLQIQSGNTVYSGTVDAFSKIIRSEGVAGLYRGFWVSSLQLLPIMMYFPIYEGTRHFLSQYCGVDSHNLKLSVGGAVATTICQTTLVPIEIVMQHLMLMGNASKTTTGVLSPQESTINHQHRHHHHHHNNNNIKGSTSSNSLGRYKMSPQDLHKPLAPLRVVLRGIYRDMGIRGFYQGFWAAVACHGPYNALFWLCYDHYDVFLSSLLPESLPRLAVISVAGPLGGMTAGFITNPMDVIRARIQVDGTKLRETLSVLWKEEGIKFMTKGASARVVSLGTQSFFTYIGYESIKRWSVFEEYRDSVRW